MLAYITGSVDQELLLRNEYLVTENRILKNQIKGRLQLTHPERITLAEIGKRLGRMALAEVAQIVRPETILGWHRKWWPGSSTVQRSERQLAVPGRARRSRIWYSSLLRRIAVGDTGELSAPCAIWDTKSATRRWPTF